MAHCIETDDKVVFAGETPWHGIGEQVSSDLTPEQMMSAARLDWKVIEYKLGLESIHNPGTYRKVEKGFKGLVRSTDGKLLDIVTDDYQVHQNAQIFDMTRQFFDAGGMTMETAGSLEGGRVIWALAKHDASFTLPGSADETSMYTLFSTGHKSGFATQADLTTIRAVCKNTVRAIRGMNGNGGDGAKYGRFRLVHSSKFTAAHAAKAVEVMKAGKDALEVYRVKAEYLSQAKWDAEVTRAFCCELLAPALFSKALEETQLTGLKSLIDAGTAGYSLEAVLQKTSAYFRPSAEPTKRGEVGMSRSAERVIELVGSQPGAEMFPSSAWNAFNAVTYYVDHERGRSRDSALNSAWYGEGATLKQSALELALAYTEAIQ